MDPEYELVPREHEHIFNPNTQPISIVQPHRTNTYSDDLDLIKDITTMYLDDLYFMTTGYIDQLEEQIQPPSPFGIDDVMRVFRGAETSTLINPKKLIAEIQGISTGSITTEPKCREFEQVPRQHEHHFNPNTQPIRILQPHHTNTSSDAPDVTPTYHTGQLKEPTRRPIPPFEIDDRVQLRQPETRPISPEQLISEVKGICTDLIIAEAKCCEVDRHNAALEMDLSRIQPFFDSISDRVCEVRAKNSPISIGSGAGQEMDGGQYPKFINDQFSSLTVIPGTLNGISVSPLVDTGADANFISSKFTKKNNIRINRNMACKHKVRLADGSYISTIGQVVLPFSFEDSPEKIHRIVFQVLRQSPEDVIIGNPFLQKTKSMSKKYSHRLKRQHRSGGGLELNLMGAKMGKRLLPGTFNGKSVFALGDTGSQANIISENFARQNGFEIEEAPENLRTLHLPGGKVVDASGICDGVFGFGETSVLMKFIVLPACTQDIILGNDFLFGFKIYEDYEYLFMNEKPDPGRLNLNLVFRRKGFEVQPRTTQQVQENTASIEMRHELNRRANFKLNIETIEPGSERDRLEREEEQRKEEWNRRNAPPLQSRQVQAAPVATTSSHSRNPQILLPTRGSSATTRGS